MKENTTLNLTNGVYVEFIYHGEGLIFINVTFRLKTISTNLFNVRRQIADNLELPAESTGMAAISQLNFGVGFFSYSLIIDGCGYDAGMHYEKTAYGICFGYNAFIMIQQ